MSRSRNYERRRRHREIGRLTISTRRADEHAKHAIREHETTWYVEGWVDPRDLGMRRPLLTRPQQKRLARTKLKAWTDRQLDRQITVVKFYKAACELVVVNEPER